jgi:hypothetical protein
MLAVESHNQLESVAEDRRWIIASERLYESRISEFTRRTALLPNEPTRIVIERFIASAIAEARKVHKPMKECPHLLTCLCRENTLIAVAAYDQARMTGENPHELVDEWMRDLNRWLQGLS